MPASIDKLIISSPYVEPKTHWRFDANVQEFVQEAGRRPAGYFIAGQGSNQYNDIGEFVELKLVNEIRPRVKEWREAGYPGVTGVTRDLLAHWYDDEARLHPLFFCQRDAMETLIWLTEAPANKRVGIHIPSDGGTFKRICTKLCTGGGKTIVMAMLIAWQVCNKVAYPQDKRFCKSVFVVAPGITVRERLKVLETGSEGNYYTEFGIVPAKLVDKLYQGKVRIINWQALAWESAEQIAKKRIVDKRGPMSDEAYARSVLGDLASHKNILVINDEAHHAWRKNPEVKISLKGQDRKEYVESEEEATIWISGLDRINKARNITACYDFTATPFAPSGKRNSGEALFGWVVSDFGLNDGIESGLVKTPRIVVRDDGTPDAETLKSKLYHIYTDETVRDDIIRDAAPEEPLPDLIRQAYRLLGKDWGVTAKSWNEQGSAVPPVMLTVANRTETAARIEYAFQHSRIDVPGLCEPDAILRIDSKVFGDDSEMATFDFSEEEPQFEKMNAKQREAFYREMANTVGQPGKIGAALCNVISVGMLSEGWDAKTVTHIMGLRAFSSQLLCEQVVGRGLRRRSYDIDQDTGMFMPEYVNIFGIPFSFLPHEADEGPKPPTKPKTQIEALKERSEFVISWPNIVRFERQMKTRLEFDLDDIDVLVLDAADARIRADMAPVLDGQTDLTMCTEIDLQKLDAELRMKTVVFLAASEVFDMLSAEWKQMGTKAGLIGQVIRLTEAFLESDKLVCEPALFAQNPLRKKILLMMSMNKIVQHIWGYIRATQIEEVLPVFEQNRRIRSTADMQTWFTAKPCVRTVHSQISHCVCDSAWEGTEAYVLEKNPHVIAWAKNDHLNFTVYYVFNGVVRRYYPDFLVKLDDGSTLVIETKGQETQRDIAKRKALEEWVAVVNSIREFGVWRNAVSYSIADIDGLIEQVLELCK